MEKTIHFLIVGPEEDLPGWLAANPCPDDRDCALRWGFQAGCALIFSGRQIDAESARLIVGASKGHLDEDDVFIQVGSAASSFYNKGLLRLFPAKRMEGSQN